jgi:Domain of unknown function (DUF397)
VEVANLANGGVIVRDTKDRRRQVALEFNREEWVAFIRGVKNGEFEP